MNTQPKLLALGSLFVAIGLVVLIGLWFGTDRAPERTEAPFGQYGNAERLNQTQPSRFWAIAAGGSLALGATLIGIGLNRWGGRERGIRGA